jgi:hypothetical protein
VPPAPIVVTRLAIRSQGAADPPTERWVRDRVALLRRLAWPALRRAGSGVAWVLVVDPERRELATELLGDVDLPGGSVHVAEGVGFVPATADLHLDAPVHVGGDRFVTLRLDSDDALLPGSIDAVVAAATGAADGTLIDLPRGYQLDLDRGDLIEVSYRRWRQGPFLALVHHGRSTMLDTGGEHTQAREGREVRRVDRPAWIQGVHGANVSNGRDAASVATRLVRAVRAVPSGAAASAWRDGRVVGSAEASALLAAAGIGDLG